MAVELIGLDGLFLCCHGHLGGFHGPFGFWCGVAALRGQIFLCLQVQLIQAGQPCPGHGLHLVELLRLLQARGLMGTAIGVAQQERLV